MIDPNEKMRSVELAAYHPEWIQLFNDSAIEIKNILQENYIALHHIGSTAIPNIYAKPIIDVLAVVKDIHRVDAFNHAFEKLDYICMGEYGIPGRRFFWKSKIKRTHNIHVFEQNSPEIKRHLLFRDFMRTHDEYAQAYSLLKRKLAAVFPQDIENYVNGKSSFVQMIDYKTGAARPAQLHAEDKIIIESYNPAWPKLAAAEIDTIIDIAGQLHYSAIEHLGSTAVPGLASKPIIDIFIAVPSITRANPWIKMLEILGYVYWDENPDKSHMRFFKGMPPFGTKRTHHVHIVENSDGTFDQRVLFRDILRKDQNMRHEYEMLKLELANSYPNDRER